MKQCCECNHLIMKCCVNLWIFPLKFILSQNPSTCLNVALIINATIVKILSPPPLVILSTRYHGSSVVDFDSVRGGISLETEKNEAGTTSRLLLTRATLRDSGNYTCVPSGAISSSVQVHVLNGESPCVPTLPEGLIKFIPFFWTTPIAGEHPAAMQTSSGPPVTTCCCPSRYLLLVLLLTLHSSNISKLIHFISTLLEMVRSMLTSVRFKIRRRRRRSRVVPVSRGSNCSVRAAALSCNHPEPSLRPAVLRQQRWSQR